MVAGPPGAGSACSELHPVEAPDARPHGDEADGRGKHCLQRQRRKDHACELSVGRLRGRVGMQGNDDQGQRQLTYDTHRQFLQRAKHFVREFYSAHGRVPTPEEYRQRATPWLAQ